MAGMLILIILFDAVLRVPALAVSVNARQRARVPALINNIRDKQNKSAGIFNRHCIRRAARMLVLAVVGRCSLFGLLPPYYRDVIIVSLLRSSVVAWRQHFLQQPDIDKTKTKTCVRAACVVYDSDTM